MKKTFPKIMATLAAAATLAGFVGAADAATRDFKGLWVNANPNTRGITKLAIKVVGKHVTVRAYGKCSPRDCDWGKVKGYAYGPNVSSNIAATARTVSAIYTKGFKQTVLVIDRSGGRLKVRSMTRFTDGSGRSAYQSFHSFKKVTLGALPFFGKPDLKITRVTWKLGLDCQPHKPVITFAVTLKNKGTRATPNITNKALVQALDARSTGWGNGAVVPPIAPGASRTVTIPVYYLKSNPGYMTSRIHRFRIKADPLKLVNEKNEANNGWRLIPIGFRHICPGV